MTTVNVSSVTNTVTVTENGSSTVVTVPAFVYQQIAPATTWTINHNLGYKPSVELLDSGSQEIDGDVAHPSDNQTVVTLNPASAGLARLI
jgi:hypothetical protein